MNKGRLVYILGPSGAGKDTLIDLARAALDGGAPVVFAHRYITRPANAGGEAHVALTAAEFDLRARHGLFALTWDSHGLRYGIGREIDLWLDAGLTVVVNGSRGHLPQAAERYPDMVPVVIRVGLDELRRRLIARGRETPEQILERLARAAAFQVEHPALVTLDNSGPAVEGGRALEAVLRTVAAGNLP
ncbi:phosphonate metabolism protein/1,5-bisphosphokinase (PRPP-forming) PhnN [Caenispirillum bisanense]|uniref:phosphonate metabolism protein/1,5-bisphosphokinase (PRPP-forming) PhnN n=1 Tax=Caenispirillum bisanense TaxID=414052 RepID=UPI0031D279D6